MSTFRWPFDRQDAAPVVADESSSDGKYSLRTRCSACGYVGDESEFLMTDADDTKCPKCGEDASVYEL